MKIGLMGFEFLSPNKGCEALTYSFLSMLNEYFKSNKDLIVYNFSAYDLGLIPEKFPDIRFFKIPFKLKDFKFRYLRTLRSCDVVFDVTMGDSFSDIYSWDYYQYLIKEKRVASRLSKKYILLPQTYGPFINENALDIAKPVFNSSFRIYCRDELSQRFLSEKLGITDSILTSDMAFVLPYDKELYRFEESKKQRIGINVSGLLYKGGFSSDNQFGLKLDYKKYITDLIEYYLNMEDKYKIHLIPHVIDESDDANDDDIKVIRMLKSNYPEVVVAPIFKTPIEAKSYISNMDVFIGARMHSTIAAFSSGVATIPVSYSRKFEGLFHSVDYHFLINTREENNQSAVLKTCEYVNKKNEMEAEQIRAMQKIQLLSNEFESSIISLLKALDNKE